MSRSLVDILMTGFMKLLKKRITLVEMNVDVKICTDRPENTDAPYYVLEVVKTKIENDIDNVLFDQEGICPPLYMSHVIGPIIVLIDNKLIKRKLLWFI